MAARVRTSCRQFLPFVLTLASTLVGQGSSGERPADGAVQARLPVRVIAGRLVLRCEVSTSIRRIPVNLFIDYDRACGFELHNKAAHGIRVDTDGGLPITIHLPGFNIEVKRREHGDEDQLDEFTKLYSKELGETACVGSIGSHVLAKYHVTFDLAQGFVYLEQPHERKDGLPKEREGSVTRAITLTNGQVWIPVRLADKRVMAMNLGTSRYDSIVDEDICEAMAHPAGDIGAVKLADFDFADHVALRPAEFVQVHADGALGTIGLNLLEQFRVEVDRVNRYVRFERVREARYPSEDLMFFKAMVDEDPDALQAFLTKHEETRLAREAAQMLVGILLDTAAPTEKFGAALEWMDKTRIADLRSTEALNTMKMLLEAGRKRLAIQAGEIGIKSGRRDRYPESVYKLHAKLGELLLEENEGVGAWEHLLSAAFGLPQDGLINLNLGRFYESKKRYKRAMSRYVQAVIKPESGPEAILGLERIQKAMGAEALSVDLVDRLISGRVYNFGAATTFKATKKTDTNRVVLVELFTNPHFGRRVREGWRSFNVGGVMGQEGLLSHFPRDRLAVLTYHVEFPEPSALMNPLSIGMADVYGSARPTYTKINGRMTGPGAGRWRAAEKIYNQNRALVLEAMEEASSYTILGNVKVQAGLVSGKVVVKGPPGSDLVLQVVLVERGVLYPGKGGVVVHRMIARAALTEKLEGVAFKASRGEMVYEFSKTLEEIRKFNEAYLDRYEERTHKAATRLSMRIDPRQVSIVAILRNKQSHAVLQALHLDAVVK